MLVPLQKTTLHIRKMSNKTNKGTAAMHPTLQCLSIRDARPEMFMAVKVQFVAFWLVVPCNVVVEYRRFGVRWRQYGAPKARYPITTPQGATTQKTTDTFHPCL